MFSTGDTDVSVGGATDILGTVIGSEEGNVALDTATPSKKTAAKAT